MVAGAPLNAVTFGACMTFASGHRENSSSSCSVTSRGTVQTVAAPCRVTGLRRFNTPSRQPTPWVSTIRTVISDLFFRVFRRRCTCHPGQSEGDPSQSDPHWTTSLPCAYTATFVLHPCWPPSQSHPSGIIRAILKSVNRGCRQSDKKT